MLDGITAEQSRHPVKVQHGSSESNDATLLEDASRSLMTNPGLKRCVLRRASHSTEHSNLRTRHTAAFDTPPHSSTRVPHTCVHMGKKAGSKKSQQLLRQHRRRSQRMSAAHCGRRRSSRAAADLMNDGEMMMTAGEERVADLTAGE